MISQTYDSNGHPVDVVEAWQLVASADNEGEAPSTFSITCTGALTLKLDSSRKLLSFGEPKDCLLYTSDAADD